MAERLEEINGIDVEKILEEINKLSPHDAYIRGRCDMWDAMNREDIKEMLEKSEQILRNLEKAKAACKRGEWIPVSERLPELVARRRYTEDVLMYDGADMRVGYFVGNDRWVIYGEDDYEPIAWMPLPEPYNPEQTLKYADNPATESALASAT